jgi:hypothetical protein
MYEELFVELKNKKNELSEEEYKECYNSIKEAKLNSDYLNSNTTTCRCYDPNELRNLICNINTLLYCHKSSSLLKKVPYLEYFLHDMTDFIKVKIVNTLEIKKDEKDYLSFDTFIAITRYLLQNFEVLFSNKDGNYIKKKFIYIIGLFNFVLQHSYYLYNVKVYTDINKCKTLVNALHNKIIDIKKEMDEKYSDCKIEYINMYEDTIENIVNKQYELITIMYDYYSETKTS